MRRILLGVLACVTAAGCFARRPDISAVSLHRDYENAAAADAKYRDRTLNVSGTVLGVDHSWVTPADYLTVAIGEGRDGRFKGVCCHFPPASAWQAARLKQGDLVVIRGICKGVLFNGFPNLWDCSVQWESAARRPELGN
jgi:hypothetical protein